MNFGLDTNVIVGHVLGPCDGLHQKVESFLERANKDVLIVPECARYEYEYTWEGVNDAGSDGKITELMASMLSYLEDMRKVLDSDMISGPDKSRMLDRLQSYNEKVRRFFNNDIQSIIPGTLGTQYFIDGMENRVMNFEGQIAGRKRDFFGKVVLHIPKNNVTVQYRRDFNRLLPKMENKNDCIIVFQVHDWCLQNSCKASFVTQDAGIWVVSVSIKECTKIEDVLDLELKPGKV